jgi:hypothetical protein
MPLLLLAILHNINTNLTAVWNFQHGRKRHHASETTTNFTDNIDNAMERTFTLISVTGAREPRITSGTHV